MARSTLISQYEYIYYHEELKTVKNTIEKLLQIPKGILSADESAERIGGKLQEINMDNSEENRRLYRQLLFQADVSDFISGIIMSHESFYQRNDDAVKFTSWLNDVGILIGVRMDTGFYNIYKGSTEYLSEGLDNIAERLTLYKNDGCKFTKWRSAFVITATKPTSYCIEENVHFMSRFAAAAHSQGIVPILTVEIVPDGEYDIIWSQRVIEKILLALLNCLNEYNVCIEGVLIETNIIQPGEDLGEYYSPQELADITLKAFERTLPPGLPGILIKSGGLSEEDATLTLQDIANSKIRKIPWTITFDFDNALQESALKAWLGKADNVPEAQEEMRKRAEANSQAVVGEYEPESVIGVASQDKLFRPNNYII